MTSMEKHVWDQWLEREVVKKALCRTKNNTYVLFIMCLYEKDTISTVRQFIKVK